MTVTELDDDVDSLDLEAEFHAAVKDLVDRTIETLKDQKWVRKLVKKGKYEKLAERVAFIAAVQPTEYSTLEILIATDKKKGLSKLAVDAAFAEQINDLAYEWEVVVDTAELLPGLTWPVIKV